MQKNVDSKNSSIIRKSKNQVKTMRQMRLRLQKKFTKNKIDPKKKFSVLLTKEEIEQKIKHFKKIYGPSSSYQICLQALNYTPFQRTIELNNMISYYLRNLKNFIHILSDLNEEEFELILYQISSHLTYEKFNKNEIICKYGDKADKFYVVIRGKIIFLVPKSNKYYMTEEEYIEHLMKLRENQEFELVKNIININQYIFYINNNENNNNKDNNNTNNIFELDEFIFNALERHINNKENKYSNYLYYKFNEYKNNREKEKNSINNNNNSNNNINIDINNYEDYIKLTKVNLPEMREERLNSKYNTNSQKNKLAKKKLVTISEYQKTNTFIDGDTFGAVGLSTKKSIRTATCICCENCHIGSLTKNEYNDFLLKIAEKTSSKLYDLIIKNNIFEKMLKNKFVFKYAHMFRFRQYNKNNMIMNEKDEIRNLIILYEGEFSMSVNVNLIELNELIIQYKKIKNKLNESEENKKNNNIEEIEENKKLLIKMKDFSKDINDVILEKNNFVLSKINNSLILGYPNTVNPNNNLSLINCKCLSNNAKAYVIDKEMLKYIDKENNYTRNIPELVTSKIDLILKRLSELKTLIMKKMKDKNNFKNYLLNINNNEVITRNFEEKKRKNLSNLVDFSQKILSKDIAKNNNLILSQNDFNKNKNNKLVLSESNLRKDFSEKEILLNKAQCRSHKFLLEQKSELKKYKRKINLVKNRAKYNDLSLIFSSRTIDKKTFLDKFKEKLEKEENIFDLQINKMNKDINLEDKINLKLIKEKDLYNNINLKTLNNINTTNTFNSLFNKFHENIKTENRLNVGNTSDTFTSFYTNSTTLMNINKKLILNPSWNNIHAINLNDKKINCLNNNYQDSYNELYLKYIFDKFKKEKNNINVDAYKTENLKTCPNKYEFPSIAVFSPEKTKEKGNKKKLKFISVPKFKNVGV